MIDDAFRRFYKTSKMIYDLVFAKNVEYFDGRRKMIHGLVTKREKPLSNRCEKRRIFRRSKKNYSWSSNETKRPSLVENEILLDYYWSKRLKRLSDFYVFGYKSRKRVIHSHLRYILRDKRIYH